MKVANGIGHKLWQH